MVIIVVSDIHALIAVIFVTAQSAIEHQSANSMGYYDYSDDYYQIGFTDPVNIYKITPACGPIEGGTKVNIYGTGFEDSKKAVFKWGPQNLVSMSSKSFL